jgi:hypothetical protein
LEDFLGRRGIRVVEALDGLKPRQRGENGEGSRDRLRHVEMEEGGGGASDGECARERGGPAIAWEWRARAVVSGVAHK